jgi:hypothetical protein
MERELFIRLALCVDPRKPAAEGLSERAVRSVGIRAEGLDAEETKHREALKAKILKEITPYRPGSSLFPGLGPHPGFPGQQQYAVEFPQSSMEAIAKKIVRGCEYVLAEQRIVEPPYVEQVYFVEASKIQDVLRHFGAFGPTHVGPGFRVTRAAAHDEPLTVMYKIDVWDSWTIFGVIDSEDGRQSIRQKSQP